MKIVIESDVHFVPGSFDNKHNYHQVYLLDGSYDVKHGLYCPKYAVQVHDEMHQMDTDAVVIGTSKGATTPHARCSVVSNGNLIFILGEWIVNLSLPDLRLIWKTKCGDCVTCFELFDIGNAYIVHGECSILRIDQNGRIVWEFFGSDIFTTPEGIDDFSVLENEIVATDWNGCVYHIDLCGKLIG